MLLSKQGAKGNRKLSEQGSSIFNFHHEQVLKLILSVQGVQSLIFSCEGHVSQVMMTISLFSFWLKLITVHPLIVHQTYWHFAWVEVPSPAKIAQKTNSHHIKKTHLPTPWRWVPWQHSCGFSSTWLTRPWPLSWQGCSQCSWSGWWLAPASNYSNSLTFPHGLGF